MGHSSNEWNGHPAMLLRKLRALLPKRSRSAKPAVDRNRVLSSLRTKYIHFKILLDSNTQLLNIFADLEEKLKGRSAFGLAWLKAQCIKIVFHTGRMIRSFEIMSGRRYPELYQRLEWIVQQLALVDTPRPEPLSSEYVLFDDRIDRSIVTVVGGKSAHLGEIRNRIGLPVARGFAVTTAAFRKWVESDELNSFIRREKEKLDVIQPETVVEVSRTIQHALLNGELPEDIAACILDAFDRLAREVGVEPDRLRIAVRSSALGEDSDMSFAGQYLSVLNATRDRLLQEYKRVVASLFSENAISYRQHMGIPFQDAAMSVACLEMVDSVVSGVMYTRHPFEPNSNQIILHALWGLGPYVVDGKIKPDMYRVEREPSMILKERRIADKPIRLVATHTGGLIEEVVPEDMRHQPTLTEIEAITLAQYGVRLERHFGCPQDVEWAIDCNGRIVILQSRPLKIGHGLGGESSEDPGPIEGYDLLITDAEIANPGIGIGSAKIVKSTSDLIGFPEGAVLVAPTSSPQYVMALHRAQAVVTDAGSMTGHMAAVCREYRIPTLMNARGATQKIRDGEMITVDARMGRVYRGQVIELQGYDEDHGAFMKGSPIYEMLQNRTRHILPLHLTDPKSEEFSSTNCRTIHDIMRYLHELSYGEIFHLSDHASDRWQATQKLISSIPLDLYVVNIGGGVAEEKSEAGRITVDDIISVPFKALLTGMLRREFHQAEPRPIELSGFFSVMSRQMLDPPNMMRERFGDKSYAIVSNKYMNFSSRVGYHYSILDSYCGRTSAKNYIHFQFKGGAADEIRRERRARCIAVILAHYGFMTEVVGDRVNARYAKDETNQMTQRLDILGRLLMYSRQMDMLMKGEEMVSVLADHFIEGNYALCCSTDGRS